MPTSKASWITSLDPASSFPIGDNTSGFCSRQTFAPKRSPSARKDDLVISVGPVRADRMQTKLIMNGIMEDQSQKVEQDHAPQRTRRAIWDTSNSALWISASGMRISTMLSAGAGKIFAVGQTIVFCGLPYLDTPPYACRVAVCSGASSRRR